MASWLGSEERICAVEVRIESFCLTLAASLNRGALAKVEEAFLEGVGHHTCTSIDVWASPAVAIREEVLMDPETERGLAKPAL